MVHLDRHLPVAHLGVVEDLPEVSLIGPAGSPASANRPTHSSRLPAWSRVSISRTSSLRHATRRAFDP